MASSTSPAPAIIAAGSLDVGDRYLWCDRVVEVLRVERPPARSGTMRAGRWLHVVTAAGEPIRRLHYYDDERVTLVP